MRPYILQSLIVLRFTLSAPLQFAANTAVAGHWSGPEKEG